MLKKSTWALVLVLVLGAAGFFAVGGTAGVALLMVKYVVRKSYGPTQTIEWQAAPVGVSADNTATGSARRPPNIILIMADDLGFNDITLNGGGVAGGKVATPHIDSIASQGAHFTNGYSANATCAPSRASLMTGRYATRFGFEFTPTPKQFMKLVVGIPDPQQQHSAVYHAEREKDLIAYEDMGLPTKEITLAKLLQGGGYHSVHLGKWHLGDSPQFRPYSHGFNESLSLLHGGSMYLPTKDPNVVNSRQDFDNIDKFLWAAEPWGVRFNSGKPFQPPKYLTDYLTDEAVKVVETNKSRPFFMYLAYNAPHTPLQATREDFDALSFIPDHATRVYAAMIRNLDRNIGRVLQALKDQGVDDNTLVIFTSDNGGAHYIGVDGVNAPYRGWKATFFEGGIRVPFFMRWPAAIPKGVKVNTAVNHFDVFATAAAAAKLEVPKDRPIDGVNLLPFTTGMAKGSAHEALFWRTAEYRVVRTQDWKLQVTERPKKDWLYQLSVDPTERNNLATKEPAQLASMKAQLAAWEKEQVKPLWPSLGEGAIAIDRTLKAPPVPNEDYIYYAN
ncbi:MAG: sulfatase-like hydrolase/transferase [Rhodoferax sp.]|nr:sulfatase-like hydrolase/transferase [Rhodoferax sp.]